MKRIFDFSFSLFALIVFSIPLSILLLFIFLQDRSNPLYIPLRVGKDENLFKMYKLRSMVVNADQTGVDSTSNNDDRITSIGLFIRKFKFDEIFQLVNVLLGDMSLVGPRPNVQRETDMYSAEEKKILSIKPGITDFSSIVFADEGDILEGAEDPDVLYNQVIRPFKSRLALFYISHQSFLLDVKILFLTALLLLSRKKALSYTAKFLEEKGCPPELLEVAKRERPLKPAPPPGLNEIITKRPISMIH